MWSKSENKEIRTDNHTKDSQERQGGNQVTKVNQILRNDINYFNKIPFSQIPQG